MLALPTARLYKDNMRVDGVLRHQSLSEQNS